MSRTSHALPMATPRPASSVYSDDASIMTALIQKVTEETRLQEYETLCTFMRENRELKDVVASYQRTWNRTIMLVNEAIQAITTTKKSLVTINSHIAKAEKDWLAFWGIYKESVGPNQPFI